MMRLGLGQWGFDYGFDAKKGKRPKPNPIPPECRDKCRDLSRDVECAACQAGSGKGDLVRPFALRHNPNQYFHPQYSAPQQTPLYGYYYPPGQVPTLGQPGQPMTLGQGITDSPWSMFVVGALTWAFFGPVIKGALGLGASAASYGIEAAHGRLQKSRSGPAPKRLPMPRGSRVSVDDED